MNNYSTDKIKLAALRLELIDTNNIVEKVLVVGKT